MNQQFQLTPAQLDFLKNAIDRFNPDEWQTELAGHAGSSRYFIRLSKEETSYILIVWDCRDEDWDRFISMQKDISAHLSYLPEVYKKDNTHGLILEEDLGNCTLKQYCLDNLNGSQKITDIYKSVLDALCKWQHLNLSVSQAVNARAMDYDTFMWETWYFSKFCVTDFCGCEKLLTKKWEKEREELARRTSLLPRVYIHRDFQSENIMIKNNDVRFVDFQGARLGPAEYDVASLLYDPYITCLSNDQILELLNYYYQTCGRTDGNNVFNMCAAQRLMQALGAYGNLSIHKAKEWYKEFVPVALERLVSILSLMPEFDQTNLIAQSCLYAVLKSDQHQQSFSKKIALEIK
jgi:aminoglycoside/choline kinase family phosphotransferase